MVRVPLLFRGLAVLLLAATTVVGQTPEPPAEFFSLDSVNPSPPNFLRQFSADPRHPLLALMADGEFASADAAPAQDSSRLKPQAKSSAVPSTTTAPSEGIPVDDGSLGGDQFQGGLMNGTLGSGQFQGGLMNGTLDGGLLDGGVSGGVLGGGMGGCGCENLGSMAPCMLPFACAPQSCCGHKCRRCGHGRCGGCGHAYQGWPCCPPCFYASPCNAGCGHRCGHKRSCGCGNYGSGGWGMECGCGCWAPPTCCGHKCRRHNRGCGCANYCSSCGGGYGGYGNGGWDMGCGGWGMGSCCMPQSCGHKCHRRHGCNNYCGCGGYGYGGWEGCGYGCGCGCSKHRFGRCHRGCQSYCYPMMMPCMEMPCMGMGTMGGMGWESFGAGGMMGGGCGCDGMQGGVIN